MNVSLSSESSIGFLPFKDSGVFLLNALADVPNELLSIAIKVALLLPLQELTSCIIPNKNPTVIYQ